MLSHHIEELEIESQNPLRYISWHPHRPVDTAYRPFNFNEQDFDYVINSTGFFCRKVDEHESAKLLDMIDAQRGAPFNMYPHNPIFV